MTTVRTEVVAFALSLCFCNIAVAVYGEYEPPMIDPNQFRPVRYLVDGRELSLTCDVTGSPTPTIQWYRDGLLLNISGLNEVRETNSGRRLTFQTLAGKYQCRAHNTVGFAFSPFTQVQWAYIKFKSSMTMEDRNVKIETGNALKLNCSELQSVPRESTTFIWQRKKNDHWQDVENHQDVWTMGASLILLNVSSDDEGLYRCKAHNSEIGDTHTDQEEWNITIIEDTGFSGTGILTDLLTSPKVVVSLWNRTAQLECFHFGKPDIDVTWSFLPMEICPGPDSPKTFTRIPKDCKNSAGGKVLFKRSNRVLELKNVQMGQEGCYQCTSRNFGDHGFYMRRMFLQIQNPPTVQITKFVQTAISPGGERTFECIANGIPQPLVTWYLNDTEYDPEKHLSWRLSENKTELTVSWAGNSDAAVITCNATNSRGTVFDSTYLLVVPGSHGNNEIIPPIPSVELPDPNEILGQYKDPHSTGGSLTVIDLKIVLPVMIGACLASAIVSAVTVCICMRQRRRSTEADDNIQSSSQVHKPVEDVHEKHERRAHRSPCDDQRKPTRQPKPDARHGSATPAKCDPCYPNTHTVDLIPIRDTKAPDRPYDRDIITPSVHSWV